MLYYDLTERLLKVSISLTSGIRADGSVWYSGVAHAQKKVIGIGGKGARCNHGQGSSEYIKVLTK
jgi:hypothetical protein